MADIKIDANVLSLKKLFSKYELLEIPQFQRPYVWGKDEWSQLWEDLYGEGSEDNEFWLLGNIVLCGVEGSDTQEVIDGQQRITTLTIMVAALRDLLVEHYKYTEEDSYYSRASSYHREMIVYDRDEYNYEEGVELRLTIGAEREWFEEHIQTLPKVPLGDKESAMEIIEEKWKPPISTGTGFGGIPNKIPTERRSLWKAYHFFYDKMRRKLVGGDYSNDIVNRTYKTIHETVQMVVTAVPDASSAYILFETLNDRGVDLSVSDLFKNLLLKKAAHFDRNSPSNESSTHTANKWKKIIDCLDYENVHKFLRYYKMADSGSKVTHNALYKEYKNEIDEITSKQSLKSFCRKMSNAAEQYAEIILATDGFTGPGGIDVNLRYDLYIFSQFSYITTHPLLIAGWTVTEDVREKTKLLKIVEEFMIKYSSLAGQVTNILEAEFPKLARHTLDGSFIDFAHIKSELDEILTNDCAGLTWERWSRNTYRTNVAKGILMRIEQALQSGERKMGSSSEIHLEHIFPQSMPPEWLTDMGFEDEEEGKKQLNRIGNLCLLDEKINKFVGNQRFPDKIADEQSGYKNSELKAVGEIRDWGKWDKGSIKKLSDWYLVQAKSIWNGLCVPLEEDLT